MQLDRPIIFSDEIVAFITARGSSKGLVGKNIKLLLGKPLIGWTIEAAKKCNKIDRVILSTDDSEIAEYAKVAGCEVPFMRPAEYATDTASSLDVVMHALEFLEKNEGKIPKAFFVLQPTSPLRNSYDLSESLEIYNNCKCDSVISVFEPSHNPRIFKIIDENGMMHDMFNDVSNPHPTRQWLEQEFGKAYCPNGAIYLVDTQKFLKQRKFYMEECAAYIMPASRSVDIDTQFDFDMAEFLMQWQNKLQMNQ